MRDVATFRGLAAKFRKLAEEADEATAAQLRELADEYEERALALDPRLQPRLPTLGD